MLNFGQKDSSIIGGFMRTPEFFKRDRTFRQPIIWVTTSFMILFHAGALAALFVFSWKALMLAVLLWWIAGSLGIGMGYHRLLTHRGYKTPKWLEYVLSVCGTLALEGGPLLWVATHRQHHQNTDKEGDPHSPHDGGFWAHMGWVLTGQTMQRNSAELLPYVPDLRKDRFHVWISRWHWVPITMLAILLFAAGGWRYVLWGIFLRTVIGLHSTWLVNSATHMWGKQRFRTRDDSRNSFWVAMLTFGEGWHNNHHAFPQSARHGLAWYELDPNWYGICILRVLGLAWDVKARKLTSSQLITGETTDGELVRRNERDHRGIRPGKHGLKGPIRVGAVPLSAEAQMNALLIYPQFPETFWSFKYALSFLGKRAAQPPLGLMTVGALLPKYWNKRLVDTNVERLRDRDLAWADVVLLSGMHIQRDALAVIVERCRKLGLRTVVGGPITSSVPAADLKADHVIIGEAEELIVGLAQDLEQGTAKDVYQATERTEMRSSPLPDVSLIKMKRYSTMTVQYSRGCPFNCEFCGIIEIYGRRPRTKDVTQVLAELDQLRSAGWKESVFIVDDNFIGNKAKAKELCVALARWRQRAKANFDFITEASLNLADDPELMQLMKDAGFKSVFLNIETPDESGLIASDKLQNTRRSLLDSVAIIQSFGMQVMGGFILGFDTDHVDVFDRMVELIQNSGIPIATVGLLQAMPRTQLFQRLWKEGRIMDAGQGNNTSELLNFLPQMDATCLIEGYRSVLKRIYSCEAYYERVKLYLSRTQPKPGERTSKQRLLAPSNVRALVTSVLRQGVFGRQRWSYWKFLLAAATHYRRCFSAAITLAVMGYHLQVMTRKLLKCVEQPVLPDSINIRTDGA
jgi:fatty-acid desaturase/radical SAM superfamily enzyme YgiQ (UPF0313 family)